MTDDLATRLVRRYDTLNGVKQTWLTHYQEIVERVMPFRQGMTQTYSPGAKLMDRIHDSHPIISLFLFAAGLHGMMTNPSSRWFSLAMTEKSLNHLDDVQRWLYEVEHIIYEVLNDTNFAFQVDEGYLDYGGLGMFCMYMAEDYQDVIYFDTLHLGSVVAGENHKGLIDTVMRKYPVTVRQVVQQFGEDRVSAKVREKTRNRPDDEVTILHAVYPRTDYQPGKRNSSQLPVASVYLETEGKHILSEKGYHEFPFLVPRFSVATREVYGRGPGMIALPDVKQLNQIEEDVMRAAQKKIDPPIMYARDSFTGPIRFVPGGASIIRGTSVADKMAPFPVPTDLGYGDEILNQKREQIGRVFYNDMLQLVRQDRMTATEVMERAEEKLRLMGPMLGRLQVEFLKPLIYRLFGVMSRRGLLPPAPPSIRGRPYRAQFVSPLAKAQRVQEATGIARTLEITLPIMQIKPEVAENWDWDKTIRLIGEVNSVPAVLFRPLDQVLQERQAVRQQVQAQTAMQQAIEATKAVPALGQEVSPQSPLGALMGAAGGETPGTEAAV